MKLSLFQLLGIIATIAITFAIGMPSVHPKANAKGDQWTKSDESKFRSAFPPISVTELAKR